MCKALDRQLNVIDQTSQSIMLSLQSVCKSHYEVHHKLANVVWNIYENTLLKLTVTLNWGSDNSDMVLKVKFLNIS